MQAMPKNVLKDRLLLSPIDKIWNPEEMQGGSFHSHLMTYIRK